MAALKDNNIEVDENLIRYCGFEPKEAFNTIDYLILHHQPDSFFVCSDRLALNCFEGIKNSKHLLESDISIVGYTNLKNANLLDP